MVIFVLNADFGFDFITVLLYNRNDKSIFFKILNIQYKSESKQ